jgi:hypothetical protein
MITVRMRAKNLSDLPSACRHNRINMAIDCGARVNDRNLVGA